MKNNRGFVVSAVLYPLLVLFLALIMGLISMSSTRKNILDNMKMEISDSIFDSVTCNCEEINSTLKKYGQSIKNIENDITAIENQISTINTTQNTIKTDLTNLTSRVSSLETNVTSLTTRVSTIENNYATKTTTNLLNTKISNLTTTVQNLSTSLTNLTNRVNTLAQQELNIYMSPSGNDSNDGLSSSKQMKTLNAVLNKYSNDSLKIILSEGTFTWERAEISNRNIYIKGQLDTSKDTSTYARSYSTCGTIESLTCKSIINMPNITLKNATLKLENIEWTTTEKARITDYYNPNHVDHPAGMIEAHYSTVVLNYVDMNRSGTATMNSDHSIKLYASTLDAFGISVYDQYNGNISAEGNSRAYARASDFSGSGGILENNSVLEAKYGGNIQLFGPDIVYADTSDCYYAYNHSGTIRIDSVHNKRGKKSGTVTVTDY